MIVIADYGVGNLQSVERMLKKGGAQAKLSSDPAEIRSADKLILPGVGHFGHCAEQLRSAPFYDALQWYALEAKKPVLGICVGGQLLGHASEEAPGVAGLGWLDMECKRFADRPGYRVPNMGWHAVKPIQPCALLKHLDDESRFYFVHSYYMVCHDPGIIVATVDYGITYTCAVRKDNILGVQFHPEKSLRYGLGVLKAFADM